MAGSYRVGPPVSNLIETEIDGDLSLYDAYTERVIVLNATASDIWRLADGEHTVEQITELLAGAYDADADAIRSDVEQVVETLIGDGLLQGP